MNSLYRRSRKRILFLFAISILIIGGIANVGYRIVNNYYGWQIIDNENQKFVEMFGHTVESESEWEAIAYAEHYTVINKSNIIVYVEGEQIFETEEPPENFKDYYVSGDGNVYTISIDNSNNTLLSIFAQEEYFINIISISVIGILMIYTVISRRMHNQRVLYDISSIEELIDDNTDKKDDLNYSELQDIYDDFYSKIRTIDLMEEKRKDNLNGLVHDLKTPITILLNHLEDIDTLEDLLLNKEVVRKSLEELSITASNLISENFASDVKEFNLSVNLEKELQTYISTFNSKNISIKYNILDDVMIKWNKRDFGRVLRNLLTNAFYYSNPDTTVYVNLTNNKGHYKLQIFNTGSLIKEEDFSRIFNKNIRDEESENTEGNGLGLYITKLLVEEIGAKIYASSNETQNIFTIEFTKGIENT